MNTNDKDLREQMEEFLPVCIFLLFLSRNYNIAIEWQLKKKRGAEQKCPILCKIISKL